MDPNTIITLLFGVGGGGAIAGLVQFLTAMRKGKAETEETLIARLNADNRAQNERADQAERALVELRRQHDNELNHMRRQRDQARDVAARMRGWLIQDGYRDVPPLDFYGGSDGG